MSIEEKIQELDKVFVDTYNEYNSIYKELEKYNGQTIRESNQKEVSEIIDRINEKYKILFPIVNWMIEKHPEAVKFSHHINNMIKAAEKIKNS